MVVTDGSPSTKATLGSNCAHVTARFDERTGWVVAIARHRQPHQGRVGRGRAVRQPRSSASPRPPASRSRGCTRERHGRREGFTAAGVACGIKPSGDPDLSLVATTDGQPVAAAAVFTQNKMTAAPVVTTNAHLTLTGGRAAAVVLNSGCANAATGAPGLADAAARCARLVAAELGCDAERGARLLHRPHRLPAADGRDRRRHPDARGRPRRPPTAASTPPRRSAPPTPTARRRSSDGDGFTVGGMAKGAAMLAPNMATMLAVLTTDAAVDPADARPRCSGPGWPRASTPCRPTAARRPTTP